jgi:hypothetical protein
MEMCIDKIHFHRLDYTGDIRLSPDLLAELFEAAEDEIMKEDDSPHADLH